MPNDNHLPKVEPIWIALGIVVWAIAEALGPRRGATFIDALERRAQEQEARRHVVAFGPITTLRRNMTQAVRLGAAWVVRVADELRATNK